MENNELKLAVRKTNLRLTTLAVANVIMMADPFVFLINKNNARITDRTSPAGTTVCALEFPMHFTLGGGANFIDKRHRSVNNTLVADGFWTERLMAADKVNEHLSLQCNVYNLWDTTYIEAAGSNFTPGAGRSVVVSAEIEF